MNGVNKNVQNWLCHPFKVSRTGKEDEQILGFK